MDWLIVTSAKQGLTSNQLVNEPHAGDVFIYQVDGLKGIAESLAVGY